MPRPSLFKALVVGFMALLAITAVPFLSSLAPSSAVESRTKTVRLSDVPVDSFIEVEWKGKPVVIFRPGAQTLNDLASINGLTNGPFLESSARPPVFIYHRLSTFQGCGLAPSPQGQLGPEWKGGWKDPCHVGAWDYAGRRVINVNGSTELPNLAVPEHRLIAGGTVVELL